MFVASILLQDLILNCPVAYLLKGPGTRYMLNDRKWPDQFTIKMCNREPHWLTTRPPSLCKCLHFPSPRAQEVELLSFLLGSIPPERLSRHDHSQFLPSFHGGSGVEEMRENSLWINKINFIRENKASHQIGYNKLTNS